VEGTVGHAVGLGRAVFVGSGVALAVGEGIIVAVGGCVGGMDEGRGEVVSVMAGLPEQAVMNKKARIKVIV
jgi:hypothetical protein